MYGGGADVKAARSDLEVFSLEGNCLQRLELQKKYNNDAFKGSDVQVTSEDLKFHFILFLKYSNYQF